jgi:hypothetical protein
MIEALVGVLFAAVFVAIYFVISLARERGDKHSVRSTELYPPALPGTSADAGRPARFKKTDELSRHHLAQGSSASRRMMTAGGTERPAPEGQS